jgi:hypothetical protein
MRRLIPVAAALLLAAAAWPRSGLAHAYPVSSTPTYGQALDPLDMSDQALSSG